MMWKASVTWRGKPSCDVGEGERYKDARLKLNKFLDSFESYAMLSLQCDDFVEFAVRNYRGEDMGSALLEKVA